MLLVNSNKPEYVDREVRKAYEELGSPKAETWEEQKQLCIGIRRICALGLMAIKMSLLRQNIISANDKQEQVQEGEKRVLP